MTDEERILCRAEVDKIIVSLKGDLKNIKGTHLVQLSQMLTTISKRYWTPDFSLMFLEVRMLGWDWVMRRKSSE